MDSKNNLPLVELKINPKKKSFVNAIALVNQPAIESDFICFSKTVKDFQFENAERMETIGAAMIPNLEIFRRDAEGKEFNVFFSAETIREISQVFMSSGFQNNMNLNHGSENANAIIFQSYIVDRPLGLFPPNNLKDLPDGTWIIGCKYSKNTWDKIKNGEFKGYSIQGMFEYFSMVLDNNDDEVFELLNHINTIINKNKKVKK